MKTLEAKPFDQNAENRKRENQLFTSTVLEAGASGQNQIGTHTLRSHRTVWFVFAAQALFFLLETGIAGQERLLLAKWHPKSEKKRRKRPFFDSADRHEKLYGQSRLYASAQGRHETGGVLSLFSSLSFDISIKNSIPKWSSDIQGLFCAKIRKMAQESNDLSTLPLRQDPLEAILVIFGRRALIFFFVWKVLEKNEKWHHFCAHGQWWSPWRRKNVEKEHLAPSNLTFLLIAIDRNGFRRLKEEGLIYKTLPQIF